MDRTLDASERTSLRPEVSVGIGPLLVATDGRAPTASAFTIARQMAEHHGVAVEVASVLEPMNALVPPLDEAVMHSTRHDEGRPALTRQSRK